jgi:hypothetical protein
MNALSLEEAYRRDIVRNDEGSERIVDGICLEWTAPVCDRLTTAMTRKTVLPSQVNRPAADDCFLNTPLQTELSVHRVVPATLDGAGEGLAVRDPDINQLSTHTRLVQLHRVRHVSSLYHHHHPQHEEEENALE